MLAVAYIFGWCFGSLSLAMLIPAAYALLSDERRAAMAFMNSSVGLFFLAGGLVLALHQSSLSLSRRQQLMVVLGVWLVLPLAAAAPFYISGVVETLPDAYFEAVSGFTTTGSTLFRRLADLPHSIVLWRSLLQWLGGLTTLLTLAFFVGRFIGAELFGRDASAIAQSAGGDLRDLQAITNGILPVYTSLTAVCFILLMLSGIPAFDALCLALSTVSTGGYMPRDGAISLYGSPMAELTLTLFMFLGAVSIVWVNALLRLNRSALRRNYEPLGLAIAVLVFGLLLAISIHQRATGNNPLELVHSLTLGLASAASLLTTTGFIIGNSEQVVVPYLVLLSVTLVGGARFSTAGGLKFSRAMTMFELSRRELRKLIYPHSVGPLLYANKSRDENVRRSVWSMFSVTIFLLVVMMLVLSYLGMSPQAALMASVAAIGNAGPVYEIARVETPHEFIAISELEPLGQMILCAGMIVGRVETLMLLGLFNRALWRG